MKKTLTMLAMAVGIFPLGHSVAFAADQGKFVENSRSLFRIVFHTKGLYVRIPVESVDRLGEIRISSRKVLVTDEALYFDKEGVLQSVSYYQKSGGRELLLKGPYEYVSGFLASGIAIGYSPSSSIPEEGLSFYTNTLNGSTNNPLRISDVFPPFFAKAALESGRRK